MRAVGREVRISSGHHHTVSTKSWSEGPGFWFLVTLVVSEGQALGRRDSLLGSIGEPAHLMALAGWGKRVCLGTLSWVSRTAITLGEERQQAGLGERTGYSSAQLSHQVSSTPRGSTTFAGETSFWAPPAHLFAGVSS